MAEESDYISGIMKSLKISMTIHPLADVQSTNIGEDTIVCGVL